MKISIKSRENRFNQWLFCVKEGFTMIELVVVTVIIAMLSTIAVAVFNNHLKKGRDSFRKSGVDTIATMVRLDRVTKNESNYDLIKFQIKNILNERSVIMPEAVGNHHYFYGYSAKKDDFFVVICGEEETVFFVKGTGSGVSAVETINPADVCDGSSVPIKERAAPLDSNAPATNMDAYTVYKLS